MPSDSILQNEAAAGLREITVLITIGGVGVTGVSLTGGTPAVLKIAKQGGGAGASAGATLTEKSGFVDIGLYALQFAAGDVDTVGDLDYELTQGTGPAFNTVRGSVPIRPALRTVDVADGALTNAKIADGFLTTAKLADNLLTAAKLTDGLLTSAKFADNFLTAAKINAAAITSAKFATDAIDANALKADAASEIATAVWAALTSANHAAGSMGDALCFIACLSMGNVVIDTVVNGSTAGIVTSIRVRGWLTGGAVGTPGAANDAEGEIFRMTKTAVDGGGGTWTSAKCVRNL